MRSSYSKRIRGCDFRRSTAPTPASRQPTPTTGLGYSRICATLLPQPLSFRKLAVSLFGSCAWSRFPKITPLLLPPVMSACLELESQSMSCSILFVQSVKQKQWVLSFWQASLSFGIREQVCDMRFITERNPIGKSAQVLGRSGYGAKGRARVFNALARRSQGRKPSGFPARHDWCLSAGA